MREVENKAEGYFGKHKVQGFFACPKRTGRRMLRFLFVESQMQISQIIFLDTLYSSIDTHQCFSEQTTSKSILLNFY